MHAFSQADIVARGCNCDWCVSGLCVVAEATGVDGSRHSFIMRVTSDYADFARDKSRHSITEGDISRVAQRLLSQMLLSRVITVWGSSWPYLRVVRWCGNPCLGIHFLSSS